MMTDIIWLQFNIIHQAYSNGVIFIPTTTGLPTYNIIPRAMTVDNSGNIYITGDHYNGSNYDAFIISYSSNGGQRWVNNYDGGSYDFATGISIDNSGSYVYITGYSYVQHNYTYNPNNNDMLTIKYKCSNGVQQWVNLFDLDDEDPLYTQYYGHGDDFAYGIDVYNGSGSQSNTPAIFICGKSRFIGETDPSSDYGNCYITVQLTTDGGVYWYALYKLDTYENGYDASALADKSFSIDWKYLHNWLQNKTEC